MGDGNVAAAVAAAVLNVIRPEPNWEMMGTFISMNASKAKGRDKHEVEFLLSLLPMRAAIAQAAAANNAAAEQVTAWYNMRKQILTYYYVLHSGWPAATLAVKNFENMQCGLPPSAFPIAAAPAPAYRPNYEPRPQGGYKNHRGRRYSKR